MKPMLLICNPGSRGGRSARTCARLFAALDARNAAYDRVFTTSLDHARELSLHANRSGRKLIVAVGGDGTINRVMNGFFSIDGRRNSTSRFGVIHTGTSPDFCKSYGIALAPERALDAMLSGRERVIRVGMVRYVPAASMGRETARTEVTRTSFFGCCANIGLGPELARAANSGIRSLIGDTAGTFFSLLLVLARYRQRACTVIADSQNMTIKRMTNIAIGRTRYIASGIRVCHELTDDDERLYLLKVSNVRFFGLPRVLGAVYRARPLPCSGDVSLSYVRRIEIRPQAAGCAVEFDGDAAGYCPCTVSLAPDPLSVAGAGEY